MAEEDLVVDFVLVVAVVVVVPFLFLECLVPILYDGVGVLVCDCAVVVSWVQEVKSILNTGCSRLLQQMLKQNYTSISLLRLNTSLTNFGTIGNQVYHVQDSKGVSLGVSSVFANSLSMTQPKFDRVLM
jgi:hypothetical protein